MKNLQKGFGLPILLIILGLVVVAGGAYWYVQSKPQTGTQSAMVSLGGGYFKDAQHVYYGAPNPQVIEGADPTTFVVVNENSIGKDSWHVYDIGTVLVGADPKTFVAVDKDSYYFKDATHVWVLPGIGKGDLMEIPNADPKTFVSLGGGSAKDAHHTYGMDAKGYFGIDGVSSHTVAPSDIAVESTTKPTITITKISERTITVQYANLTDTVGGPTPPSSLWIQNEGWSKPTLQIDMNGAPSGTMSFTLPANAPEGKYTISPVGIPAKSSTGGIGPGFTGYSGATVDFYVTNGSISATPVSTLGMTPYANSKYGFSVQYPSNLAPDPRSDQFLIEIPTSDSNEGPYYVRVNVDPVDASCMSVPADPTGERGIKDNGTVQINGVAFKSISSGDVSTGWSNGETDYSTIHNSLCYTIAVDTKGMSPSRLDGADLTAAETASDYLSNTSNAIVQSFKFTQ